MIEIDGCDISDNGIGISVPKGTQMKVSGSRLAGNGIGVVERNLDEEGGGAEIAKAFIEAARVDGADAGQLLKTYARD